MYIGTYLPCSIFFYSLPPTTTDDGNAGLDPSHWPLRPLYLISNTCLGSLPRSTSLANPPSLTLCTYTAPTNSQPTFPSSVTLSLSTTGL